MFSRASGSLFWTGVAAFAIGIIAIVFPGVPLSFVVAIFAVVAFVGAFHEAERAFSSESAGPVAGHLLLGVVSLAAGVGALVYPGITVWVLLIWVASWAVVVGVGRFGMAFAAHETAGERALYGFGGLLSIALGIVLFARPGIGAVSLAEVFGLFSIAYGTWSIVLATSASAVGSRIDTALRPHA
ncbi:MAG TPA: DUF308 domain-containing protein [Candidatus Angelobacter sp.]|nr:DUF308 domain-containing protein [Candidatus Angelobacter sp.]